MSEQVQQIDATHEQQLVYLEAYARGADGGALSRRAASYLLARFRSSPQVLLRREVEPTGRGLAETRDSVKTQKTEVLGLAAVASSSRIRPETFDGLQTVSEDRRDTEQFMGVCANCKWFRNERDLIVLNAEHEKVKRSKPDLYICASPRLQRSPIVNPVTGASTPRVTHCVVENFDGNCTSFSGALTVRAAGGSS